MSGSFGTESMIQKGHTESRKAKKKANHKESSFFCLVCNLTLISPEKCSPVSLFHLKQRKKRPLFPLLSKHLTPPVFVPAGSLLSILAAK